MRYETNIQLAISNVAFIRHIKASGLVKVIAPVMICVVLSEKYSLTVRVTVFKFQPGKYIQEMGAKICQPYPSLITNHKSFYSPRIYALVCAKIDIKRVYKFTLNFSAASCMYYTYITKLYHT